MLYVHGLLHVKLCVNKVYAIKALYKTYTTDNNPPAGYDLHGRQL